jgi:hypothetical protein
MSIGVISTHNQPRANRHDRSAADRHPEQSSQQLGCRANAQRKRTAQQAHQGTEARAVMTALHPLRQRSAGAGGATGTEQAVQPVFNHFRLDRRDVDHLMAVGRRIHS